MKDKYFPKELQGKYIGDGRWRLIRPFEYHPDKGKKIEVPIGFPSDGASIPKFAYSIIGGRWTGRYTKASIIHDWLYHSQTTTRKEADIIFIVAMRVLGVSLWKRVTMYRIVRMFGFIPWNRRAKALKSLKKKKTT